MSLPPAYATENVGGCLSPIQLSPMKNKYAFNIFSLRYTAEETLALPFW